MTTDNARGPWLLPAIVGLGAAAFGLGAGWRLRGSQPTAAPVAVQAAAEVTREELEVWKLDFLARIGELAQSPRGEVALATATSPSAELLELSRRFDALETRVALLSNGIRPNLGGRTWASARGPGSESIERIIERIREARAQGIKLDTGVQTAFGALQEALAHEHFLWMLEDVVGTYGPPERVETTHGLELFYGRFALEGEEDACAVCFILNEGFVQDVDWECRKSR